MSAPKQTDPQFKLRLTPELKRQIEEEAKRNKRSMNAEILARLALTFHEEFFPLSDIGAMAVLKRVEAGQTYVEDLLVAHYRPGIDKMIEDAAKEGRHLTRAQAVFEIVSGYLEANGYGSSPLETFDNVKRKKQ